MALLHSLLGIAACYNFTFEALHIPGANNLMADTLSRFNWQVFRLLTPDSSPIPTQFRERFYADYFPTIRGPVSALCVQHLHLSVNDISVNRWVDPSQIQANIKV